MIVEFPSGSYMEWITVNIQTKENPERTLIELFRNNCAQSGNNNGQISS